MAGVKRARQRRVKGEGSLFQRASDGKWCATFSHRHGGLTRRHVVYAATKTEASEKLRVLREQLRVGVDPSRKRSPRISDVIETWLSDVQRTRRLSTYERYRQTAAHVTLAIGDVRLVDVTADTVRALDAALVRAKATTSGRDKARTALSSALTAAVREGKLARNPVTDVPPPQHVAKRVPAITADETRALIAAAADDRLGALYILAATAGLRLGELFGLKRADLDLKRRKLTVQRSLRETPTGVVENEPKTVAGHRTVVLTETAAAALQAHLTTHPKNAPYVFIAEKGGPLRKSVFTRKEWKPFLERHGLSATWTIRQLRHSAATRMAEAGAHPRFVMEQMGHTSTEMTLGIYSHATSELQERAVSGLDALLRGDDLLHSVLHEKKKAAR